MVSGELVRVIGPKPDGWRGLGQYYDDAVLVEYPPTSACPEGEIGAVPREWVQEVDS
jgi:hypothetical protein